jgi:hypothetical protein
MDSVKDVSPSVKRVCELALFPCPPPRPYAVPRNSADMYVVLIRRSPIP